MLSAPNTKFFKYPYKEILRFVIFATILGASPKRHGGFSATTAPLNTHAFSRCSTFLVLWRLRSPPRQVSRRDLVGYVIESRQLLYNLRRATSFSHVQIPFGIFSNSFSIMKARDCRTEGLIDNRKGVLIILSLRSDYCYAILKTELKDVKQSAKNLTRGYNFLCDVSLWFNSFQG